MTGFVLSARDIETLSTTIGSSGLRDSIRNMLGPEDTKYYISGREEGICRSVRISADAILSLGPLSPEMECVRACVRSCGLPCMYLYARTGGRA